MTHFVWRRWVVIAVISVAAIYYSANKAAYCGMSFIRAPLPNSVKIDYFNGEIWFVDRLEFALLAPNITINTNEDSQVTVEKTLRYAFNKRVLYIWFQEVNGGVYRVEIEREGVRHSELVSVADRLGLQGSPESSGGNLTWISLENGACGWGKIYAFLVSIAAVLALVFLAKLARYYIARGRSTSG